MVHVAEQAINDCGINCDLIDLQTLVPWDRDAIVNSIEKTGRCVIVHEAPKTSGFGAEMAASVQESRDGIHHSRTQLSGITCLVPQESLTR
jgi:2-oxoisovalerate dehydrogenase E1 component beta subunit